MYQQRTTTSGWNSTQQSSQVIYATEVTTVTTQVNNSQQQQTFQQNSMLDAFGIPNDQDSFGDASKDKRNIPQYKSFDWSDPNKYESLRNILPTGSAPPLSTPTTSIQPIQPTPGQMYPPGMVQGNFHSTGGVPPSPFTVPNNMPPGSMPFITPSGLPNPLQPSYPPQQYPFPQGTIPSQMSQQQILQMQQHQFQQQHLQQQQLQQQLQQQQLQQQQLQLQQQEQLRQQQLQEQQRQEQLKQEQLKQEQLRQQELLRQQQLQQQEQLRQQQLQQEQQRQQELLRQQQLQQEQIKQQQLLEQQRQQELLRQQQLQQEQLRIEQLKQQQLQEQQRQQELLRQQQLQQHQEQLRQEHLRQQQLQQQQQQQQQQAVQSAPRIPPPNALAPPPGGNISAGVANMVFVPMLASQGGSISGSISPPLSSIGPTPILSNPVNYNTAPSPVPVSPPSPAYNANRAPTPTLAKLAPPPSARSASPSIVSAPSPTPVHNTTISANYTSSNVQYTETKQLTPKSDTSDDLFFMQMSQKGPSSPQLPQANPFHNVQQTQILSQQQFQYSQTQQIQQSGMPQPSIQVQTAPPSQTEREPSFGMLQKPPPGRERARSTNESKKQREDQARVSRDLAASPAPSFPASPTSSGGGGGSTSAPTTPSNVGSNSLSFNTSFPPSTPTSAGSNVAPLISTSFASLPISPASAPPSTFATPSSANVSPALTSISGPSSTASSPYLAPTSFPTISPTNSALYAKEHHIKKVGSVDCNVDLLGLEPMSLQEMEEKRRQEIEKRVREELEEKHKQEIMKIHQAYEAQKTVEGDTTNNVPTQQPAAVSSGRSRSASHSSALPPPFVASSVPPSGSQTARALPTPGTRTLPPPPASNRQHSNSPKLPHAPPAATASLSPPTRVSNSLAPATASGNPPSPSLVVDNATLERRQQIRSQLANIIVKPPTSSHGVGLNSNSNPNSNPKGVPAGGFNMFAAQPTSSATDNIVPTQAPPASLYAHNHEQPIRSAADRRSISFDVDVLNSKLDANSVACPICGEHYQSERVLAVHIDDTHGLSSVIGPNSIKKQVKFANDTTPRKQSTANLDALDLSFGSPLGKSRSVDDIRTPKKDDSAFGFEGFGMSTTTTTTPAKPELSRSNEKEKEGNRSLRSLFGRSREKSESNSNYAPAKEASQIVDLGEFMGTPTVPPKSESTSSVPSSGGSSFFRKGKSNSMSNRQHAPRPSILDSDLITGSPRHPGIDFTKVGQENNKPNQLLKPKKPKKKDAVPLTSETAAAKIQATYKMMRAQKEYKKHIFKTKVARELVTTEHTYVESIENAIKTFAIPLRQMVESGKPLIAMEDINSMFSRLEQILTVNGALLEKLTLRIAKWTVVQKIGDVCVDVLSNPIHGLDFRKVYNDYTISYNTILETLERCCREKSAFKRFIQNGEKTFWGAAGNTIQAFFILPVQRITRYILLFKEVIKYTSPTHPDYESLCSTLREMECICIDVNENQRKEDTEKKRVQTLMAIQNKVEPRLKDLMVDGRYLLREGVLSQFDVDDDQIKERYYFLFNDIILITKKQKQKYLMRIHITLHNVRIKDIPDSQNFLGHAIANAFEMHTPSKTIMFLAQTVEDKEIILKELTEVIAHAKESSSSSLNY